MAARLMVRCAQCTPPDAGRCWRSQVVLALREIVTASSHTAQSITRISQVSKDMAQLSGRLDELVHQFKLDAASGTTQG